VMLIVASPRTTLPSFAYTQANLYAKSRANPALTP
jgi:hypothetical protein